MARREVDDEMLARRAIRRLQRLGVRHVKVEQRARKVTASGAMPHGRTTTPVHGRAADTPLEALEALAEAARDRASERRARPRRAKAARLGRADVVEPRRKPADRDGGRIVPRPRMRPDRAPETPAAAPGRDRPRGGR